MPLYLPHNNWFVLQLKEGVQGLQAFAFNAATMMEPPVLFKFVSIANTPMSRVNKN